MRKGFKSLLTVAVTLLGFKAMAMAPVVSNIPDVIIGDAEAGTASNLFVFPDAFNVDNMVSDDSTTAGGIKWTYQVVGTPIKYNINRHSPSDLTTDLLNPQAQFSLTDTTQADDPNTSDSNRHTLTFRNIIYSPYAGGNTAPAQVNVTTASQNLTLTASDGSTRTQSNIFRCFVINNGNDALSGSVGVKVLDQSFTGSTNGWVTAETLVISGTVLLSSGANGLCMDASAAGINLSGWASQAFYDGTAAHPTPYSSLSLTDNAVYKLRGTMSTAAAAGQVPLWRFIVQNSVDLYGGTYIYFDSGTNPTANANSIVTRQVFDAYFAAPSISSATFKSGVINAVSMASLKDFRVLCQVLDVGTAGNDPYGAGSDTGAICLKRLEITKYGYSGMTVLGTPYSVTAITSPVDAAAGTQNSDANAVHTDNFSPANSGAATYSGGDITIAPQTATSFQTNDAFFQVVPGDATNALSGGADMIDNYPVTIAADEVYQVGYGLQAADANSETNGLDFFFVGGDCPTNDIIVNVFATNYGTGTPSMPKLAANTYVAFYATNGGITQTGNFKRFRPHAFLGTNSAFTTGNNSGSTKVTDISVKKVKF